MPRPGRCRAESLGSFRYLTPAVNAVWMMDGKAGIVKVGP